MEARLILLLAFVSVVLIGNSVALWLAYKTLSNITTTVTGTVFAPEGTIPLYNAIVYVPNATPEPFKSEVVCEQGKLIKLNKDKKGVVSREVLTKKWTDWVDYWAVDFDYESRKEIIKVAKGTGINVVQGYLAGRNQRNRK